MWQFMDQCDILGFLHWPNNIFHGTTDTLDELLNSHVTVSDACSSADWLETLLCQGNKTPSPEEHNLDRVVEAVS